MDDDGRIAPQHYAFLISEAEFDAIFRRIREQGLAFWADPTRKRPGEINHGDGGRGVSLRGAGRAFSGDHHPALRQRRA